MVRGGIFDTAVYFTGHSRLVDTVRAFIMGTIGARRYVFLSLLFRRRRRRFSLFLFSSFFLRVAGGATVTPGDARTRLVRRRRKTATGSLYISPRPLFFSRTLISTHISSADDRLVSRIHLPISHTTAMPRLETA